MFRIAKTLPALALVGLAAGCASTSGGDSLKNSAAYTPSTLSVAAFEAQLDTLKTANFKYKATATADIAAMLDALPSAVTVSYDEISTDKSGAAVVSGLKIAPAMMPSIGLSIDNIRFWGLDSDLAVARLNGQRLDETGKLARRVEANHMSIFGVQETIAPFLAMAAAGSEEMKGVSFDTFNFSIDKLVYDDLVLRPFVMEAKVLDIESVGQYFPILQQIVAVNRSFAADSAATYGMKINAELTQGGMQNALNVAMDLAGTKGLRGGDVDRTVMRGLTYTLAVPSIEAEAGFSSMSANITHQTSSDLRLDKVLGYLARGVMPPRTETDLMSLGVSTLGKETMSYSGEEIFSVDEGSMDFSGFHWLIPSRFNYQISNAVYDIPGLMSTVISSEDLAMDEEERAQFDIVMQALARQGLDKPSMDLGFGWNWNGDNGATGLDIGFGIDNFMHATLNLAGQTPNFQSVSDLVPDFENADQEGLQNLFMSTSKFSGFNLTLNDEGGLDKGFALAIDIAKLAPEDDSTAAMLRNATPEGLRSMASTMLMMASGAAAEEIPAVQGYAAALSGFLGQGGTLQISSTPAQPLGAMDFMSLDQNDPNGMIAALGVSVTHTPPPK